MKSIRDYYHKYTLQHLFLEDRSSLFVLKKYKSGDYLCKEGEILPGILFLVEGKVKVCKNLENGRSVNLSVYSPMQVIGDIELVTGIVAQSTVQAIGTCLVLALPKSHARRVLEEDIKFSNFICNNLARKLVSTSNNSSINQLYPLEERLASYILAVLENEDSTVFHENLTNLADSLGTSYRHLLRTLKKLCERGILKKQSEGYVVIDKEKLNQVAGDAYIPLARFNL